MILLLGRHPANCIGDFPKCTGATLFVVGKELGPPEFHAIVRLFARVGAEGSWLNQRG